MARLRSPGPVAVLSMLLALPLVAAGPAGVVDLRAGVADPQVGVVEPLIGVVRTSTTPEVPDALLTRAVGAAVEPVVPRPEPVPPRPEDRAASEAPAPLPSSRPTHVRIATIEVDSELVGLGLEDDGRMEVPPGAFPAGWYTGAPTPGELGPAVLAGHVDHGGELGVFHRLRELAPGDAVEVEREDGTTAVFRVTRVEQHGKDSFPTAAVYGDIDHAGLRLITCGGAFDQGAGSYEDNIVVFAELEAPPVP